jgi:hypothetical protein
MQCKFGWAPRDAPLPPGNGRTSKPQMMTLTEAGDARYRILRVEEFTDLLGADLERRRQSSDSTVASSRRTKITAVGEVRVSP